mgnify:CR=1 FL=1
MKIYKGQVDWNDSFQELANCWAEAGYCEVNRSIDNFSWAVQQKGGPATLLHEYDRLQEVPSRETWDINRNLGLFANDQHPLGKPWIYWPRHIKNVEAVLKETPPEKDIHSIFVGAAENPIQYVNRTKYDWSLAVDHYEFKNANKKLSDIEDLVKRKVILYDHKAKSSDYKFGKEFKLKTIGIEFLPDYIRNNKDHFKNWID